MRDYGNVSRWFWIGATGKRLRGDKEAQILAVYLMTGPMSTMTGVYYCSMASMAHETGLGLEGVSKGLARLIEEGFCEYDTDSETVFVVTMASWQIGDSLEANDKRVIGLRREVKGMFPPALQRRFIEVYNERFSLNLEAPPPSPSEAPPEDHRSQKQKQEQKQEQNQKQDVSVEEPRIRVEVDTAREGDDARADQNSVVPIGTPAGRAAKALREVGIPITPTHPELLGAIARGIPLDEMLDAGRSAVQAGKPNTGYLFGVLYGRRQDAASRGTATARPSVGRRENVVNQSFEGIDYGVPE